ncbi:MAG: 1-(5-phosphoribosyl)-5-[(5-phosphoribosylamino)methylideneamino]imidazole-4-carboxamide isomerase [Chloroflexi bacterium]|jgi:phosphoribosylformimino-5-aminoimidazole carboxamide ribotide isomerase|nr:1-(5-phosphoribosyl)-5-[(5-phosphoribosylamino)methylideneamino]imidazole-4-carboxamide isomerase [Chloroflexota bacterium]|tara:strand:+ start:4830 stop:5546 length:717 start_codon:yes stop_codon:yes gene_type:complete
MKIYPALDIKNGKCVRLIKGNYNDEIVFNKNPLDVVKEFEDAGSKYLHVIDLDGAKEGDTKIITIVEQIVQQTSLKIQIGGGIRIYEQAKLYLDIGVDRIIFGTSAIYNQKEIIKTINEFNSNKIVVSIDALKGKIKTSGWLKNTKKSIKNLISELEMIGVQSFIYTDIEKDGTLSAPNFEYIKKFRELSKKELLIAGGISSIEDIFKLEKINIDGAIIGMALYTNQINLKNALKNLQ